MIKNLFSQEIFDFLKNIFFWCYTFLDGLQFANFSLLDLFLGFFFISAFIPAVLNLRNVQGFADTSYSALEHFYKPKKKNKKGD